MRIKEVIKAQQLGKTLEGREFEVTIDGKKHTVRWMNYLGWPDHEVPTGESIKDFQLMLTEFIDVLLNSEPYKSMTRFAMSEDGFSAQLGTTIDPTKIKNFLPHLLEAQPIWKDDYVCTSTGVKHTIVHQYDRIPNWRSIIEARYS